MAGLGDEIENGAAVLLGFGLESSLAMGVGVLEFQDGGGKVGTLGVGDLRLEREQFLIRG